MKTKFAKAVHRDIYERHLQQARAKLQKSSPQFSTPVCDKF